MIYELTRDIIRREIVRVSSKLGLKCYGWVGHGMSQNQQTLVFVTERDAYYKAVPKSDFRRSLEDFSNLHIVPAIAEITNDQTQYDDAGQVI